jgi:hypothetical protein
MPTKYTQLSFHGKPCNPNLIQVLTNCLVREVVGIDDKGPR